MYSEVYSWTKRNSPVLPELKAEKCETKKHLGKQQNKIRSAHRAVDRDPLPLHLYTRNSWQVGGCPGGVQQGESGKDR